MQNIGDNTVDMILCDPPYGITSASEWDNIIPFEPMWKQYRRICKENAAIVLMAAQPFASQLIVSNSEMFRYDLVWEKNKVTGFLNAKKMPLRRHELVLVFYQKPPTYNPQKTTGHNPVNSFTKTSDGYIYGATKKNFSGGGQTDRYPTSVLKFPVVNNDSKEKIHPSQKPLALFEWLVKTYSNAGDLILDNAMGSGTAGLASMLNNRRFIGIEANAKYFEAASKRLHDYLHM